MLNKVFIMGRLARDPELRRTQTGLSVASFTLAVDRDYKDKASGERGVDWIECTAWRQTADFVCKYFTKGRMAVVEGRLQISDWTDKYGIKRRKAEVVADQVYFGDSKPAGQSSAPAQSYTPPPGYGAPPAQEFTQLDDDVGELPF